MEHSAANNSILISRRRTKSNSNMNCCVYGCKAVSKRNPELMFHRIPKPGDTIKTNFFGKAQLIDRRKQWEEALSSGKKISLNMRVCSLHFKDSDYLTPNVLCISKRHLKKDAVPSQNLPKIKNFSNKYKPRRSLNLVSKDEDVDICESSSSMALDISLIDKNSRNLQKTCNGQISVGTQTDRIQMKDIGTQTHFPQ